MRPNDGHGSSIGSGTRHPERRKSENNKSKARYVQGREKRNLKWRGGRVGGGGGCLNVRESPEPSPFRPGTRAPRDKRNAKHRQDAGAQKRELHGGGEDEYQEPVQFPRKIFKISQP